MENELRDRLNRLDRRVGLFLNAGIILGLVLLLAGLALFVAKSMPQSAPLTPLVQLPAGLAGLDAAAFVTCGLMVILLMPLVVLITSFVHFIMTRERLPLIVCIILLLMLAASYVLLLK